MTRAIVLLSQSDQDAEYVRSVFKDLINVEAYLDCDSGREFSCEPSATSTRVLCILWMIGRPHNQTTQYISRNTGRLGGIINKFVQGGREVIVGTHTRTLPPGAVLSVADFAGVRLQRYSTAIPRYTFLADWMQERSKSLACTNVELQKKNFDELFGCLERDSRLTLGEEVGLRRHEIAHLFVTPDLDIQLWREGAQTLSSSYNDRSLTALRREASQLLDGDDHLIDRIEQAIDAMDRDARRRAKRALLQVLEVLKGGGGGGADAEFADFVAGRNGGDGKRSDGPFHAWFQEVMGALDEMRKCLEEYDEG